MSKAKINLYLKATAVMTFFACLGAVVVFKLGVLDVGNVSTNGLSGMVAVKGSVSADDLGLNADEVKKINRTVEAHRGIFAKVDLFLDAKQRGDASKGTTVLVMAMVLETNEDCEVRSWSRKISRKDLVSQVVVYMEKAAKEYKQFKKYPDVKQNFKCLYI